MKGAWRSLFAVCGVIALTAPAPAQPKKQPPAVAVPDNIDVAYGAYQRGMYLTALAEANKRAQQNDPRAMTLLGEIYAQGLGVGRDDGKAAQWYKQSAALGDRDAMFALAMFAFEGRAGQPCRFPPPTRQ